MAFLQFGTRAGACDFLPVRLAGRILRFARRIDIRVDGSAFVGLGTRTRRLGFLAAGLARLVVLKIAVLINVVVSGALVQLGTRTGTGFGARTVFTFAGVNRTGGLFDGY